MDKQMIRAYLWQAVIRLGFCPASTKDQQGWLYQYGQSIKDFWETSYPKPPRMENGRITAVIDCTDILNLSLIYQVDSTHKFSVRFRYSYTLNDKKLIWIHDVDGNFFCFPPQLFLSRDGQEKVALKGFVPDDVEAVIDGLLLHPKAHQHIESPINNHDIRIGGGIDNPFLYLFHLRYQLCPIPVKQNTERDRLVALFSSALRSNRYIAANKLMAQP